MDNEEQIEELKLELRALQVHSDSLEETIPHYQGRILAYKQFATLVHVFCEQAPKESLKSALEHHLIGDVPLELIRGEDPGLALAFEARNQVLEELISQFG